jgi:NitT/TauT family transport system ATP-binding protein
MAAGGVDPDEDVRLVVLPPPYMVESLANKHVDAFCVGAPWNSIAVDLGIGFILHFVSEILPRAAEKVLAFRSRWAQEHPETLAKLVRAHASAADYIEDVANRDEVSAILGAPHRIDVAAEVIRRTLDGRLKVAPDGATRSDANYLLVGRDGAGRPDPTQAAWLYAQMVRWSQSPLSEEMCRAAMAVFRPDLYDAAMGTAPMAATAKIGAFAGPPFDPRDISGHLASWRIGSVPIT